MKRNKFFSPVLMIEGIKQTKAIGICFAVISILASCGYPLLRLISYASMDYDTLKQQPYFTIDIATFSMPIFLIQYIMPMVMIFFLFNFMNKRKASDFYHSIPLSKTCVYLTYTATALIWSIVTVVVSTFLSFTIYALSLRTAINTEFIWPTIISSIILAMLVASIALIAKGLSGTLFTNIIITLIIMFLPRIIILLYTIAVNELVKITDVSFISLADIYNNVIFVPFVYLDTSISEKTLPILNTSTLWYSAILAIVYFVIGFFIHKFRKSESAGKSAAYKGVQLIVRILIGSIPLLIISFNLACGLKVDAVFWLIGIVVSVLAYFLYEFITTKSVKKLLISIPFYFIAILANVIFTVACVCESNFILNDIPEPSEISSVSISYYNDYLNSSYIDDNYYKYKTENITFDDKELIKYLQSSLVETVEKVKENKFNKFYSENYVEYDIIFYCSSGRNIKRRAYVNTNKFNNNLSLESYIRKNNKYKNAIYSLPTDKELKSIDINSSNVDFSKDEIDEIWKIYKEEFNSASDKNKDILIYRDDNSRKLDDNSNMIVTGYVGVNNFSQHYFIDAKITPKTYSKFVNKTMSKLIKDNIVDTVKKNANNAEYFSLEFLDIKEKNNYFLLSYYDDNINSEDHVMDSTVDGALKRYNINYNDSTIDKKYVSDLRKVANIIINSISDNVDVEKDNLIKCTLSTDIDFEYLYDDDKISGYSMNAQVKTVYVNITDEQYDEINRILSKCSKHTDYAELEY